MADDIDIEEHDVLESLRRRRAPAADATPVDVSGDVVVKSEPLDIEYEPHYEETANECHWEWDKDAPEIKIEPHTEPEDIPFGKIILGSKPATPPPRVLSQDEYNYNMSLVLDDWGPMLERSECYCHECKILFATINALDSHKMLAHSFLVAIETSPGRNKAFKSTAKPTNEDQQTCEICQFHFKGIVGKFNLKRHYRRVHRVDPDTLENKNFKSWRLCNHCNLYFPNDTSLVKHLYELLPLNNRTPTKVDRKSVGQSARQVKPALNLGKEAKAVSKDVKTYNQANRIILGSKPSKKTEPAVSRSDDLKTDKYKCEVCAIQYHKKYYYLHMRKFHPDIAYEKPQKSPDKIILNDANVRYKCIICNQILLTHYLACKHRAKHPDMKRRKIIVKLVKSKAKSNVSPPTKVYKKKPKLANKDTADDVPDMMVSKSVLFKCNRCSVHFLTCTGACQHSIVCETSSNIRDWECPQCQKVFRSAEKSAHEYQHKVTNASKLKVYVVYLEIIVRVLCECPHCFVCFEEDKFWKHVVAGCDHAAASYYCGECRLPVDAAARASHDGKHRRGDFTRDDFIKIDYITPKIIRPKIKRELEEPRGTERKLEIPEVPLKKSKPNPADQFQLFYCSICKQYLASRSDFHISGKCKDNMKRARNFCTICGIYFSQKYHRTHMSLHERHPSLTVANFAFTRMSDSKKIKPQPPQPYLCKTCDVYFVNKISRRLHKCEEIESSYCKICQKKIHRKAYKVHMQIHNYVIPSKVKSNQKVPKVASPKPLPRKETELPMVLKLPLKGTKSMTKLLPKEIPPVTKLPDLLMKYQSLTALWNILYLCATCDTFTDSYDKVVEHCQNHLTNMENYGVLINMCQKCDMKFDSECYKRHLELHAGNKIINKKTFQILKYEYFNLFSDKWFDFLNVPEEQKSQIIERSIYGENRCVRMRLSQQGPPECTLYRCSKCTNCVSADTIVYHVRLVQCVKANKVACSICDMTFTMRAQCDRHERIHQATGLGAQSFRIVAFNDARDTETNLKIMAYDTDHQASRSKISFADDEIPPKPPKSPTSDKNRAKKHFVFYKCAQCHVCLVHLKNFNRHTCSHVRKHECDKCGLLFSPKMYNSHNQLHAKYAFSKNNVITKTVNKDGKVVNIIKQSQDNVAVAARPRPEKPKLTEEPKLYKCYCGLHFTSLRTIEKHYKLKNCSTVIREKCSQCDLIFDPIEVVNHLCKHHAQSRVKSFNIVTPNKKTLYKCGVCHVLFYNKDAAVLHKSRCIGKYCAKKCVKCGLAFDAISLSTHMADHERNDKLKTDCYIIVKIPDEKPKIQKPISPSTLYRCKICDIHFLRRTSARNHLVHGRHGHTKPRKCKICGLGFLAKTMPKHVAWQHHKLKIKQFDVKELIVGVNTTTPRPNSIVATQIKESKTPVKKPAEAVTPKVKPVPKEAKQRERKVTVYKCAKCALYFTEEHSLASHHEDRCSKELSEECEDCAVKFAAKNIKEHKKQHGPGVTLNLEVVADGNIARDVRKEDDSTVSLSGYDNTLYRCTGCDFYYNCKKTLQCHYPSQCNPDATGFKCEECDISFTKKSLHRHKLIHEEYKCKKDDFIVFTLAGLDNSDAKIKKEQDERPTLQEDTMVAFGSSFELESRETLETPTLKVKESKKVEPNTHTLCKCADCNVYFVTLRACHKHIINHTSFDSRDYIECKLCGFQFTIMTLPMHIKKHHEKQFNLEEVLVEEYRPNDVKTCDIYYASEKDQSRLVSTSDDVKHVTNCNEDNENEVTSCNQIESSSFKSETDSQDTTDSTDIKSCEQLSNLKVPTESSSDSNVNAEPLEESILT